MKNNKDNYQPICPECGQPMTNVYENVGFTEPEGPSKYEVSGYYCHFCGHKEPLT